MEYEIHVTVKTSNIEKFKSVCNELDVKPIIIETEKDEVFEQQVMTSSKYKGEAMKGNLEMICSRLLTDFEVIRKKIEIFPKEVKDKNHIYYESHFRLKLLIGFDKKEFLIDLCKENNFHLSKNLFKKTVDFNYQMITYRNSNISYEGFKKVINDMKDKLDTLSIPYDKVEIEECVYDSNISVDKNWL